MSWYLGRYKYSQGSVAGLVAHPQDRTATVESLMNALGAKLHYIFFCQGEYDAVAIFEAPDNISAVAGSMVAIAGGGITDSEITPLLTMEEALEAMRKASVVSESYSPP